VIYAPLVADIVIQKTSILIFLCVGVLPYRETFSACSIVPKKEFISFAV
jgi:hypothetical protein